MWLTRLAISRPLLIWMVLAAIAVLGLLAYSRLPAELNPRVDIPTLTVTTIYPGAAPPEIETQVSKPLEDAVGTVGGVKEVYSSSQPNVSIISMDFQVGTDLNVAQAEVRGRVESVRGQLPAGAQPPVVAKLDINAQPILYLGLECPSLSLQELRTVADTALRPRLQRVPGIATVQALGGEEREIHVDVDPRKLAQLGLTLEDVVNALKASGRDVPGGTITQGSQATDVRLTGAYTSLDAVRDTVILAQNAPLGAAPTAPGALPTPPPTIADVATVTPAPAAPDTIDRINGRDGVSL